MLGGVSKSFLFLRVGKRIGRLGYGVGVCFFGWGDELKSERGDGDGKDGGGWCGVGG